MARPSMEAGAGFSDCCEADLLRDGRTMQTLAIFRNCEGNALARRCGVIIVDVLWSRELSSDLSKRIQSVERQARNHVECGRSREQ